MADKKDLSITIGAITIKEIEYIELMQHDGREESAKADLSSGHGQN